MEPARTRHPVWTAARDIGVGVLSTIGGSLAVAGAVTLIVGEAMAPGASAGRVVGVSLYAFCLVYRFVMAAVAGFTKSGTLKALSSAGEFLIIAGTLMPYLLAPAGGAAQWILFGVVWALAIGGYLLWLTGNALVGPYIVWVEYFAVFIALPLLGPVRSLLGGEAATWLLVGGGLYILGLLFRSRRGFPYADALWTAFSASGAVIHYFALSVASS